MFVEEEEDGLQNILPAVSSWFLYLFLLPVLPFLNLKGSPATE